MKFSSGGRSKVLPVASLTMVVAGCVSNSDVTSKELAAVQATAVVQQRAREARGEFARALRERDVRDAGDVVRVARNLFPGFEGYAYMGLGHGFVFDEVVRGARAAVDLVFTRRETAQVDGDVYSDSAEVALCIRFTVDVSAQRLHVRVRNTRCPSLEEGMTAEEYFTRIVTFDPRRDPGNLQPVTPTRNWSQNRPKGEGFYGTS